MGKGSDLWDDSALVDAFHHAVATYNTMHRASYKPESYEDDHTADGAADDCEPVPERIPSRGVKHDNAQDNELQVSSRDCVPVHDNENTSEGLQRQENCVNASQSFAKEPDPQSFCSGVDNGLNDSSCSEQQSVYYNSLLNQYYEIEEQRQKVLNQLQQLSYTSYVNPVADFTLQQVPENNASVNFVQVSEKNTSVSGVQLPLTTCSCHCVPVPMVPLSSCGINGIPCGVSGGFQPLVQCGPCSTGISCTNESAQKSAHVDDNVVKVGMMAAERAISSIRTEITPDVNIIGEKGKDKEGITCEHENIAEECFGQETDLSVVLSAWYSAGFYTGRYLSEMYRRQDKSQ